MHPSEVKTLGLWHQDRITSFRENLRPNRIAVVLSDLHVGANNSLLPSPFELLDGTTILGNAIHLDIFAKWKLFWKIVRYWGYDSIYFLGDLPSATSHRFHNNSVLDIMDLDNQKEALYQLLKVPCEVLESHFISGTNTAHDSIDTKVHLDLAKRLGGKFHYSGKIVERIGPHYVEMGHQARLGALYPSGVLEREAIFQGFGISSKRTKDIRNRIGGHFHMWEEINKNGFVITTVPGWQDYYPIKGKIVYEGIRTPDIGGMVLLSTDDGVLTIPYVFELPSGE